MSRTDLSKTLDSARKKLLAERNSRGIWRGCLSSSPLATATALGALDKIDREKHAGRINRGLDRIADNQNGDGGWGDAPDCISNPAATVLCWSVLDLRSDNRFENTKKEAEKWIVREMGGTSPEIIARAVEKAYGRDRTFSVPILAFAAIFGRLGKDGWKYVRQFPFELGLVPHRLLKWMRLPVVSYALPAMLAIGITRDHHRSARWLPLKILRYALKPHAMKKLAAIQPGSGGFLEAIPLTAFCAASLASTGLADNPVIVKAEKFLVDSQRKDGSWPVDMDLATWLTTSATTALSKELARRDRDIVRSYILDTQRRDNDPLTQAAPGGWGWTDLPGGVPDADDTASALLALRELGPDGEEKRYSEAIEDGVRWLLGLRNRNGGWPTFCRGWGKLPFDRSCPDITAHAVSAIMLNKDTLDEKLSGEATRSVDLALDYLEETQSPDGWFVPLWFGNQNRHKGENPVYGASVVAKHLLSVCDEVPRTWRIIRPALEYLVEAKGERGWGGGEGLEPTVEETSVALESLAIASRHAERPTGTREAVAAGVAALVDMTNWGTCFKPAPVGLYFARLWYSEYLYPLIFATRSLTAAWDYE